MEVKSVSDCLNIIDIAIVKNIDTGGLENLREWLLQKRMTDCDDEREALWCVFKQINLKTYNLYKPFGADQKTRYLELRKLVLRWVIENNSKQEDDK